MMSAGPGTHGVPLDVLIFGGGAAGLWLLDALVEAGHGVLLLEADRLGAGQTVCAQGIIHGGVKYALNGRLTPAAAAVREMPDLWRRCLAGAAAPRLTGTRVRAEHCHLWRSGSAGAALAMMAARVLLRVTPRRVETRDRPRVLESCPGEVALLAEPVIDPVSLLSDLGDRHARRMLRIDGAAVEFEVDEATRIASVRVQAPGSRSALVLSPGAVVFAAGAGNEALCARAGMHELGRQQRRPLHMLMVRGDLPVLNGHCVDARGPRVTITTDTDSAGTTVWQVGGRIAEEGVAQETSRFIERGIRELREVLPGLELPGAEFASYRIDRAEGNWPGGRPDDVMVARQGNAIVAWPTKLCLVPRLAERVVPMLDAPSGTADQPDIGDWPRPEVALPPWETQAEWFPAA